MQQLPQKDLYKLSDVCRFTETQPYVLRFWESEFPQLSPRKSASGQRLYRKKDIAVVCRIKELLYERSRTLEEARQQLADDLAQGKRLKVAPAADSLPIEDAEDDAPAEPRSQRSRAGKATRVREPAVEEREVEMVTRQRYEDALDEIDHLRGAFREAEKKQRSAEGATQEARENAERDRMRAECAIDHIERVMNMLA